MDTNLLNTIRYCFQRILVPCVVIIGVLGNFISVIVLTRRRMRSPTNIYLTALAVADIVYLLFVFVLSLEHYPNIHHVKYRIYWSTYGLSHWLCDASSYTSIYLTVSFTVERYIAVCHPIRGQVLCTESRAKKVIAVVVIMCFLLTMTTPFEYKLEEEIQYVNRYTDAKCSHNNRSLQYENIDTRRKSTTTTSSLLIAGDAIDYSVGSNLRDVTDGDSRFQSNSVPVNDLLFDDADFRDIEVGARLNENSFYEFVFNEYEERDKREDNTFNVDLANLTEINSSLYNKTGVWDVNNCKKVILLTANPSDFGNNSFYRNAFYVFTSTFFTLIPLILLATFNCFLIAAVHRSRKMRHEMTNCRQNDTSTTQENKVTVTLIAVVLLFLVCQTPQAVQLVYTLQNGDQRPSNTELAFNNLFNFLITLNAACNFLLYCALSDKYRKTLKQIVYGRSLNRRSTVSSSSYISRYGGQTSTTSFCSRNDQPGEIRKRIQMPIISSEKKKKFSMTANDYANLQSTVASSIARDKAQLAQYKSQKKQNDCPDIEITEIHRNGEANPQSILRKNSVNTPAITIQNLNNQTPSNNRFLKSSPSDTSLCRTRSLEFTIPVKHSPDCKHNSNNL